VSGRLPEGKVPWDLIADLVQADLPPEVVLGPAAGEDASLVELGGELWALSSDPVSFTAHDAGRLAVVVNANDVAVRGARPRFFLAAVLLAPGEATLERARELVGQVRDACSELGVALVGGHTEVAPGLGHSLVVGTMLGRVEGRPVTTSGLRPGDRVGLTRWAGLEGTSILLDELGERVALVPGADLFRPRQEVCPRAWLSVVAAALAAAAVPGVSCLHDVTEGGVGEALYELERASGLDVEVDPGAVPVQPETRVLCAALGMDPFGLIGSGALLVGCGEGSVGDLEDACGAVDVPLTWIGRAAAPGSAVRRLPRFPRDELLKMCLMRGVEAVVFDMDGTLVSSHYDWPAIRHQLGVFDESLIDGLNGLPHDQREARWRLLCEIEDRATSAATLLPGAWEVLEGVRRRGLRTALVTNNTDANASALLERFGLRFDHVLTRDSGLWKPWAAPFEEAARRLGVVPAATLAVGDSHQDLTAARAAGCRAVCLVHGGAERWGREADLALPDLEALARYLELVGGVEI